MEAGNIATWFKLISYNTSTASQIAIKCCSVIHVSRINSALFTADSFIQITVVKCSQALATEVSALFLLVSGARMRILLYSIGYTYLEKVKRPLLYSVQPIHAYK